MTIHKSQGQTLGRVKVDLGRVFEKGQGQLDDAFSDDRHRFFYLKVSSPDEQTTLAYVAISRATSLESLQILNFQPAKFVSYLIL